MWDRTYPEQRYQLTYDKANLWRRTILIMYCSQFFDNSKKTFRDRFLELTEEFAQQLPPIKERTLKLADTNALHLNTHSVDDQLRKNLTSNFLKIVNKTSNDLAQHLYQKYIYEMEVVLNKICPEENNLFRTKKLH
ncbi:unnamed protein product [Didymodactylos carnosus]|nr:unnamed protein product [Didymodactylos carnosus]CAF3769033.1 unnamed protein product [Didymodactylos carnosus]